MPERSFGRTVRYRRTKLGLSQAKLGELVGRSTATIKSWERDKSRPNDDQVLFALAAILGVDESRLFAKVDMDPPATVETSHTIEQALASLSIDESRPRLIDSPLEPEGHEIENGRVDDTTSDTEEETSPETGPEPERSDAPRPISVPQTPPPAVAIAPPTAASVNVSWDEDDEAMSESEDSLVGSGTDSPAYVAPPEPFVQTPLTPTLADVSYMEDHSQRQLYRVRTLATLVAFVALFVAFVWAAGEGIGALGEWWDGFFGNLRL